MNRNEFSVCQFFMDGSYEYVRRFVSMDEAVEAVKHYCTSVGARMGLVTRVIITDGGDCINFEWTKEKGVIFPTEKDFTDAHTPEDSDSRG